MVARVEGMIGDWAALTGLDTDTYVIDNSYHDCN